MSISHEKLLMHKNWTVNRNNSFNDICGKRHVYIAYSAPNDFVTVNSVTGKLEEDPKDHEHGFTKISWNWEIYKSFLENNNIHPHWIDLGWMVGDASYNHSTGKWAEGYGMLQSDQIDILAVDVFDSFDSIQVANLSHWSPPIRHMKFHWFTRWPQNVSPIWNLIYLFPEE